MTAPLCPAFIGGAKAPVAQLVEQRPFKPVVAGSSPAGGIRMLKVFSREKDKKAESYRREGYIPGVIYGPNLESTPIIAQKKDFLKFYENYESGLFEVYLNEKKFLGILQEIQFHPITDEIIHFDIFVPSLEEKIITKVPLEFIGEAPGVKLGGIVNISLEELEIECLPQDIPQAIYVDLSSLKNIGDTIYVKDIKIPPNIRVLINPENPIATLIEESKIEEENQISAS